MEIKPVQIKFIKIISKWSINKQPVYIDVIPNFQVVCLCKWLVNHISHFNPCICKSYVISYQWEINVNKYWFSKVKDDRSFSHVKKSKASVEYVVEDSYTSTTSHNQPKTLKYLAHISKNPRNLFWYLQISQFKYHKPHKFDFLQFQKVPFFRDLQHRWCMISKFLQS